MLNEVRASVPLSGFIFELRKLCMTCIVFFFFFFPSFPPMFVFLSVSTCWNIPCSWIDSIHVLLCFIALDNPFRVSCPSVINVLFLAGVGLYLQNCFVVCLVSNEYWM